MVPNISRIVANYLRWNKKYKFDFNSRGHITRIPEIATKKFFKLECLYAKFALRANFLLLLSDHIDNLKFHNSSAMNWILNICLGF